MRCAGMGWWWPEIGSNRRELRPGGYPACKTLLCSVYDPEDYCKNPTLLQNDLTKKHGAIDVVVMVRPLLK